MYIEQLISKLQAVQAEFGNIFVDKADIKCIVKYDHYSEVVVEISDAKQQKVLDKISYIN